MVEDAGQADRPSYSKQLATPLHQSSMVNRFFFFFFQIEFIALGSCGQALSSICVLPAPADSGSHSCGPSLAVQIQALTVLVTVVLPWKVSAYIAAPPHPSLVLLCPA